jgi:putative endonuclease
MVGGRLQEKRLLLRAIPGRGPSLRGAQRRSNPALVLDHGLFPIVHASRHKAMKNSTVYMMANKRNGTIYTGVTSNLSRRAWEHREALVSGFTARYGCKLLVWFEFHVSMQDAIAREKQIKAGSRKKKLTLIEANNPLWRDLYEDLV